MGGDEFRVKSYEEKGAEKKGIAKSKK